ncbi:AAA family ATPase [bacterium]|nr:AAA family ATPase [bacterium]
MENKIIGQKRLLHRFEQLVESSKYPRFSILVGPKGSGKKTIAKLLCKEISDGIYEECGIKIADVRELIKDSYKVHSTAVYLIPDADNMTAAAKNAMLKVVEEPPNNSFFIMTLESIENNLETIISRAAVFFMDRYTPDEILQFAEKDSNTHYVSEIKNIITGICDTPGDVITLYNSGIKEFYDYVQLVANNILDVSIANALKISNKVALKDDVDGYDLRLFWKAFIKVCFERIDEYASWGLMVDVTSKYLQRLRIRGANKQMLMDNWIIEVRDVWT